MRLRELNIYVWKDENESLSPTKIIKNGVNTEMSELISEKFLKNTGEELFNFGPDNDLLDYQIKI